MPSKTSPNVALTSPPHVNIDLQRLPQDFCSPGCWVSLEGVLDGVEELL